MCKGSIAFFILFFNEHELNLRASSYSYSYDIIMKFYFCKNGYVPTNENHIFEMKVKVNRFFLRILYAFVLERSYDIRIYTNIIFKFFQKIRRNIFFDSHWLTSLLSPPCPALTLSLFLFDLHFFFIFYFTCGTIFPLFTNMLYMYVS